MGASSSSSRPKAQQGFRQCLHITHTSTPHIDDQTIVQDDSQAIHPRRILPSPTLLCCTDQNRPRRPRYRSSKLPAAIASMSTHSPLRRCHRHHKRPQPRCTTVKTQVGAAGSCHRADKGLASASS
uniref:Uncharacterized protein n=1 Tax=Oryza barthii TaxID=65489 RepID=A0A0D3GM18_9ORYZ